MDSRGPNISIEINTKHVPLAWQRAIINQRTEGFFFLSLPQSPEFYHQ